MALIQFILLFLIGLFGPILLFRWFMQKYVGRDDGLMDRAEDFGRRWGDTHWQQMNQPQTGEAEKRKSQHDFEGARMQSAPTPMYITDTSRLALDEKSDAADPVSLSDLLHDTKHKNKK